ncbi:LOW QUALITY PROTEIN: Gag protein, partial [Phytophthora palmivora]
MDRGEFPHLTDSQFESVRKMVGIFGGDALRSLPAASPSRSNASRRSTRLIAHVQGLEAPVAEMKPAQPKPLRLKINPYEGKEGENPHFWVREVELAMDAALISTERLRVAFALSDLGGWAKIWAYTRETTMPGCFTTWAQLCQQLRAAFLPANYEYHQPSRFLACKQGKRELHEYIQEMRVLAASLVGNPLPEHIKVTVFMDSLKVGPSRTQLFRVHANTMDEAIQIALQEVYSHRQTRTPTSCKELQQLGLSQVRYSWNWVRSYRAPSTVTDVGSSGTCKVPVPREGKGSSLPNLGARGARGKSRDPRVRGTGVTRAGRPTGEDLSPHGRSADGARHGGLAPESLGALETRKSSGGLLVVHASVRGYGDPFRVLIDSGASTNFARRQMAARNGDKYADALRESEGRGQVSVRLADGTVVNISGVRMDLAVKLEDFDSTELFLVLDMNKYDLILGMPWLEKHEPWIDWRGNAIGASQPQSTTEFCNVPTSVRGWGARDGRQGAYAPEEVLGATGSNEDVAMSPATGREAKAYCQACGIATTASLKAESRRAVWASTVAGNIGPQPAEAAEESAKGVSCVGNIGPQAGNAVPQTAEALEEDAESTSGVGDIVPRKVEETKKNESAACVFSSSTRDQKDQHEGGGAIEHLCSEPRRIKVIHQSQSNTNSKSQRKPPRVASRVDNQVPHSEAETPPARPVKNQCHVLDGMSGRQDKAGAAYLEALPEGTAEPRELSMQDFLDELKTAVIADMVLLQPETSPEDLRSSSIMDEDVLEGFTKQRATRLGSEILKNPEDPVYPLVKEYSDVVSKHPPSQLLLDRGVRHEIDLVPGTRYCVTRQWPLPCEQCEVINAFFAEKAMSGMVRESKSPHSTPTFC